MFADTPTNLDELQLPVHTLNEHAALYPWLSETLGHTDPLADECQFFNFSQANSAEYCTHSFDNDEYDRGPSSRARAGAAVVESSASCPRNWPGHPRRLPRHPRGCHHHHRTAASAAHAQRRRARPRPRSYLGPTRFVSFQNASFQQLTTSKYLTDQRRIDTRNFVGDDAFCIRCCASPSNATVGRSSTENNSTALTK